jgi:hypothetical protein
MESPYKEILSAIIGGGLVGALIQGLKFIKELMDAKRKEKEAKEAKHLSDAAEIRRIENESDQSVMGNHRRIEAGSC